MLKFPAMPERRSNPSSSFLNHLTSSSNYSPTHSNQSSPRYALSPYTNHQQPRRFSLHVVLRKTSDHQQPTQTNLEDIIAKPDNYHITCKSANIKPDILLDTRESHNNITKSPYIPSNNAFNLDSFIKSSEGKTANTLSITKGISEYDAAALLADTAKLRRNTKTYKSRGISIFAPKQEKPTDQLQLQQKGSKESIASLLNCSFEKEFEGLNSSPSSEHDQSKLNSEEKLSLASAEDIPMSKKTVKEPSMVQIPLSRIMRRRSCCCSDCGHLSEFEKKNQNLTNPTKREELNLLLVENARKELILAQEKLRKEEEEENDLIEKEGNSDEKGLNEQVHTSLLKVINVVLNTEEFHPQSTSLLTPQMVTDAGYETIRGSNNDETKRTNPLKDAKSKNQARKHQTSHSPKNFGIKLPKNGVIQNTFRSEITQSPLSIPFSGVMTRKGSTSSIMYTKADSPTTMYTEQGDVLGGLQQKLQKLQITSRVKSTEEHEESKKKVEKMHTMSEAFLRKSEKTTTLPALPRLNKGVSMPKANTTIGKLSIQSIQGVYMNSSGNTTPKIYSVQQSPVNKASASGSMNFSKESSPRPKICIIASQNPEFKRRGSGTGYKLTEGKEEEMKRSSNKNCITTLETIDFMNGVHLKKDSLAIALQEKDEEYGKSEVYNKDAEKGGRPIKRVHRKKQKQGSQVEKRSLSMGMLLKAYQTQAKNGVQTKKFVGV